MEISPIVGVDGRQLFTAGGAQAWRTHQMGEWCMSLEWAVRNDGSFGRYLVIWPASSLLVTPGSTGAGMWAISSTSAQFFCEFTADGKATGGPSLRCQQAVVDVLPMLGRDSNDQRARASLTDVVMRYLPDLVLMPPAPRAVRESLRPKQITWEVQIARGADVLSEAAA